MSTIERYNNGVEVWGMKPVADGVVYHTYYQAHNLVTDEVTECGNLADLVECTVTWNEPSNAINWHEVTYKGDKRFFSVEDVVHSEYLNEHLRHMVYRLRDSLRLNKTLLTTIRNRSEDDLGKHILNCIEPAILNQMTLDQRARAIDIFKRESIVLPEDLPSREYVQEVLADNWTEIVFGVEE